MMKVVTWFFILFIAGVFMELVIAIFLIIQAQPLLATTAIAALFLTFIGTWGLISAYLGTLLQTHETNKKLLNTLIQVQKAYRAFTDGKLRLDEFSIILHRILEE